MKTAPIVLAVLCVMSTVVPAVAETYDLWGDWNSYNPVGPWTYGRYTGGSDGEFSASVRRWTNPEPDGITVLRVHWHDWVTRVSRPRARYREWTAQRRVRGFYRQFIRSGDLCFDIGANMGSRTATWPPGTGGLAKITARSWQTACWASCRRCSTGRPRSDSKAGTRASA